MNKNKVLPIVETAKYIADSPFVSVATAQRDEDWKRVKGLIEDLEAIAHFHLNPSDTAALGLRGCQELARQALASLEEDKRYGNP